MEGVKDIGRVKKVLVSVIKNSLINLNIISDITFLRPQWRDKINSATSK